jgi:hypothetical protein
MTARHVRKVPLRLTSITWSQSSTETSAIVPSWSTPAAFHQAGKVTGFCDLGDEGLDGSGIGDVQLRGFDGTTCLGKPRLLSTRPVDVPVGQDDPVTAGSEGLARGQPDSACPTRHNHGAHPEDQLPWSKGRSVLVCRADVPVCAEAGEVTVLGLSVAFLQYADQSASRPGDCPSEWRVIMIGRTLARPTERVDLGQQRKVWGWEQ